MPAAQSPNDESAAADHPAWPTVLRSLREAAGVTQEGWAAQLGLGRRTIQRWEQAEVVPDAAAEAALLSLCQRKGLFRAYRVESLAGYQLTAELLQALLVDARLAVPSNGVARDTTSPPPPPASRTQLPTPLTSFLGREQELVALSQLLANHRLVTLTGPGGVGKTRLALQLAAELVDVFTDGVFFVDLAPLADPALIPAAVARVLGVQEQPGVPLHERLAFVLRDKRLLVLLDNYEHLLAEATFAAALLQASPTLSLLITSRAPLRLIGEKEYAVLPLPVPAGARETPAALVNNAAVQLFVARAQAVRSDFVLSEATTGAVAAICRRLDGLPLAIELAAAWMRLLSPAALLTRLEHRLPLLTDGARDLPARQQALRDTIAWSYALLAPAEQRLFRRLAVFAGGCTLEVAETVCNNAGDLGIAVLDGLSSLVEKSLVQASAGPEGEPRFGMLATIREFASERLAADADWQPLMGWHAASFLDLGERIGQALADRRAEALWLRRADSEQENLRAALAWYLAGGDAEAGLRLAAALSGWFRLRSPQEGRDWLERLLTLPGSQRPTAARARALTALGYLLWYVGDGERARQRCREAVRLARTLAAPRELAWALQGQARAMPADDRASLETAETALALFRELGDDAGVAWTLNIVGRACWNIEELDAARAAWQESLAAEHQRAGLTSLAASVTANLGSLAAEQGDFAAAADRMAESLGILRVLGVPASARILLEVGVAQWQLGRLDAAADALATGLALAARTAAISDLIDCVTGLAMVAFRRDQPERAVRLLAAMEAADKREHINLSSLRWWIRARAEQVERARAALGERQFRYLWAEGEGLGLDEAVDLALQETDAAAGHLPV